MKEVLQTDVTQFEDPLGVGRVAGGDGASVSNPEGLPVAELRKELEAGEFAVHALPDFIPQVPPGKERMARTKSWTTGDSGAAAYVDDD